MSICRSLDCVPNFRKKSFNYVVIHLYFPESIFSLLIQSLISNDFKAAFYFAIQTLKIFIKLQNSSNDEIQNNPSRTSCRPFHPQFILFSLTNPKTILWSKNTKSKTLKSNSDESSKLNKSLAMWTWKFSMICISLYWAVCL